MDKIKPKKKMAMGKMMKGGVAKKKMMGGGMSKKPMYKKGGMTKPKKAVLGAMIAKKLKK
tara:strand:+ start:310 stop:489 length:180 start_codon:yes stop_codon:yes gene_type:complete